jgi:hypothetical protein
MGTARLTDPARRVGSIRRRLHQRADVDDRKGRGHGNGGILVGG